MDQPAIWFPVSKRVLGTVLSSTQKDIRDVHARGPPAGWPPKTKQSEL
jgi:hypothetical protein